MPSGHTVVDHILAPVKTTQSTPHRAPKPGSFGVLYYYIRKMAEQNVQLAVLQRDKVTTLQQKKGMKTFFAESRKN